MSSPEIKHDLFIPFGSEYGPEEEKAVLDVLHDNAAGCRVHFAASSVEEASSLFFSVFGRPRRRRYTGRRSDRSPGALRRWLRRNARNRHRRRSSNEERRLRFA